MSARRRSQRSYWWLTGGRVAFPQEIVSVASAVAVAWPVWTPGSVSMDAFPVTADTASDIGKGD